MIEGIHILNSTEITTLPTWCVMGCILLLIACVALFVIGLVVNSIELMTSSLAPLFSALITLVLGLTSMVGTGRYKYEVTIDSSVTFSEIYEKYDVIEQRGEIWVLEDLE